MTDYDTTHVPDDDCTVKRTLTADTNDCEPVTGVTANARVKECLLRAKGRGLVVETIPPSGRTYQYMPYITRGNCGTIWVQHDCQSDTAKIVEYPTVFNMVYISRPDVTLIDEADSEFAGDA